MRILITGGCGFLGAHLVEHLLKNTPETTQIIVLDRMTYASSGFDRLRDIQRDSNGGDAAYKRRVSVLGCDLAQPIPDGVAHELGQIDYVIHAAAETHVDNSIVDPLPFLQANVIGTHHLLWWARRQERLRRIFLVSTDEVYGPADWGASGNVEADAFRPANPYAAAKAGGEAVGMAYANTYRLPITIVNTMNLYGERQHREKFIPLVIRSVLQGTKVTIHADPSKTRSGTRYYIHARNFASAIQWLMKLDVLVRAGEAMRRTPHHNPVIALLQEVALRASDPIVKPLPLKVHVAGEKEVSNLDLAVMIAKFVPGAEPLRYELVDFHSSRPGHDLRYALDDSAMRKTGWRQPVDFEASLERTVKWYLANPSWLGLT
jgi:dTDP-glucose 4,6-dehydratase